MHSPPHPDGLTTEQVRRDPESYGSILNHIVGAIESSTLDETPFPHFFAEGLFPNDVYARMIELLPSMEYYESFGYDGARSAGSRESRMRFRMDNASLHRLPAEYREVWSTIRNVFGSVELREAVFRKLAPGLARRFKCEAGQVADIPGFPLPELFRETAGYRIKPHPDTNEKVVTMQVSLSRDRSQSDLGTEFYRIGRSPASWLREPRGFDIVKTMPFLPNAGYAFAVLNSIFVRSWHGRSTLLASSGVRNSLLNFWYVKPDRANKDLLNVSRMP